MAFDVKAAEGGVDYVQTADLYDGSKQTQLYSGLGGQALNAKEKEFPTIAQVLAKIPKECFERSTAKSLMYAGISTAITLSVGLVAWGNRAYCVLFASMDCIRVRGWDGGDWVLGCCARVWARSVLG